MVANIAIPKLGFTMVDAKLVEWKAKEGDWVEKGSGVLVIEGEKSSWEIEVENSGFLHITAQSGNKALVGEVVGVICETKEELDSAQKQTPPIVPTGPVVAKATTKAEAIPSAKAGDGKGKTYY